MNQMSLVSLQTVLGARRSARAFADVPLSRSRIEALLVAASSAPSWCNTQPWRAHVLSGALIEKVRADFREASRNREACPDLPFPPGYAGELLERKREADDELGRAAGIGPHDIKARVTAVKRNWEFFGAPQALILTVPRSIGPYALLDLGCFLQSLLLAVTADGLAACPQASLAQFPHVLRRHLDLSEDEAIACGVSLGVPADEAVNGCRTSRIGSSVFSSFYEDT